MTPTAATALAESVVQDGFGAHRRALGALFAGARRRGVRETLLAIAADPDAPTVARERALGRIVVAYCALAPVVDGGDREAAPAPVPEPDARPVAEPCVAPAA